MTQEQKNRIGMLRQWLNEDRIDDPNKMVTNEELLSWLTDGKCTHYSDCAVHNEPAYPNGECNCGNGKDKDGNCTAKIINLD